MAHSAASFLEIRIAGDGSGVYSQINAEGPPSYVILQRLSLAAPRGPQAQLDQLGLTLNLAVTISQGGQQHIGEPHHGRELLFRLGGNPHR